VTNPATGVQDISEEKQTSELNAKKPVSNIDMLGATDALAQVGIATGNSTITKAGILGNTAVQAVQQFKGLKGLKGINKTAGVASIGGGVADTVDQMFFGN
jgi:hypothetical protein